MEKKTIPPLTTGITLGALLIIFAIFTTVHGIEKSKSFGWIQYFVIFIGVIGGCVLYAKQMDGNVSFGNVFAHGFKITAVMTSIFILYFALALKVFFPDLKEKTLAVAQSEMITQKVEMEKAKEKGPTPEQIQQQIDFARQHFFPFAIGGTLLLNLVLGAVASVAGAVVAPKNPNFIPFDQIGNS